MIWVDISDIVYCTFVYLSFTDYSWMSAKEWSLLSNSEFSIRLGTKGQSQTSTYSFTVL